MKFSVIIHPPLNILFHFQLNLEVFKPYFWTKFNLLSHCDELTAASAPAEDSFKEQKVAESDVDGSL